MREEMLLWKALSLFILLHNLGSSGKNLLRTLDAKLHLRRFIANLTFFLLRPVRMTMKNTARFLDQTGKFRRTCSKRYTTANNYLVIIRGNLNTP